MILSYSVLDFPGRDGLPVLPLVQDFELLFAPDQVVFPDLDDAGLLLSRNLPLPGVLGSCALAFQGFEVLAVKPVLPLVEGLSGDGKVTADQRGIPLGPGLVEDEPLQALLGLPGETKELCLLSPQLACLSKGSASFFLAAQYCS